MQDETAPESKYAIELESCLEVGLEVFLDANPGSANSKRYPARVRGWERNRYIILGLAQGTSMPAVRQGKNCVIRFMHEGEVWGFTAQFAEETLTGGYPLLQLFWPVEVAHVQVRKHERVAVQTPCKIINEQGEDIAGTIGDLSGGGCSLILDREVKIGSQLKLSFRMPDGGKVEDRPVIVRNRKKVPGQGLKYGCQFQIAEEKDHSIELFVARKIAVNRGETAPHPQILVLSRDEADVGIVQQALSGSPFEVVEAAGILDLGYRLRTCAAEGILISFAQKELSAIEVLPLIRQSPGMEEMPLVMYGGTELHDQALTMGATLCINDLSEARQVLSILPEPKEPEAPAPADSGPDPDGGATETAAEAAPAVTGESAPSEEDGDDDEITFEE